MAPILREIEKIEILTLLDNYVDMVAQDNSDMVQRPCRWMTDIFARASPPSTDTPP